MAPITLPESLVRALREKRLVLFAGAGLSSQECPNPAQGGSPMPALPMAPQLQERLKQALKGDDGGARDLGEMADYFVHHPHSSRNELVSLLQDWLRFPPDRPLPRAHQVLSAIPWQAIITTNYDHLIERALDENRVSHRKLVLDPSFTLGTPDQLNVLKIHGDLDVPTSLVITRGDFDDFDRRYPSIQSYLSFLARTSIFLFVGYGLRDRDFQHLWAMVQGDVKLLRWRSFAVDRAGAVSPADQAYWERNGIHVIEIAHFDQVPVLFEALGAAAGVLGMKSPPAVTIDARPSADRREIEERWCRVVLEETRYLPPIGIFQFDQTIRRKDVPLEDIYVPPTLRRVTPDMEDWRLRKTTLCCPACGEALQQRGGQGGEGPDPSTARWDHPGSAWGTRGAIWDQGERSEDVVGTGASETFACSNAGCRDYGKEIPLTAARRRHGGDDSGDGSTEASIGAARLFASSCRWVVLGEPAVGKTSLLKYLALQVASGRSAAVGLRADLLPLFFRGVDYADAIRKDRTLSFQDFLLQYVPSRVADVTPEHLRDLLARGRVLLVVDALDEVPESVPELEENLRRRVATDCLNFLRLRQDCPFVISARPAGYRVARLAAEIPHAAIDRLDPDRQQTLIGKWFGKWAEWEGDTPAEAERAARDVWQRIQETPGVAALVDHPLLLTVALLVHRVEKKIPERRLEFYAAAVRTIAQTWEAEKRRLPGLQFPPVDDMLRVLSAVAYRMHLRGATAMAPDLLRAWLVDTLTAELGLGVEAARRQAADFLRVLSLRLGLLMEAGPGYFAFVHLTFQEFFAARYLVRHLRDPGERGRLLLDRLHDSWWEEVLRLTIAGLPRDGAEAMLRMVLAACSPFEEHLGRDLRLAGHCLADLPLVGNEIRDEIVASLVERARSAPPSMANWFLDTLAPIVRAQRTAGMEVPPACFELVREMIGSTEETRLVAGVRFAAAAGMCEPEIRQKILGLVSDARGGVRVSAVDYLAHIGAAEPEVRGAILKLLADPLVGARFSAVDYFARVGATDTQYRRVFLELLRRGHSRVRDSVIEYFTRIRAGDPEVRGAMLKVLRDANRGDRYSAVDYFAHIGTQDPEVRGAILRLLRDPDEVDRSSAFDYLVRRGATDPEVKGTVLRLLSDPDAGVRYSATVYFGCVETSDPEVRSAVLELLGEADATVSLSAVEYFIRIRAPHSEVRGAVLRLLADPRGLVRQSAMGYFIRVGDSDPGVRRVALELLRGGDFDGRHFAVLYFSRVGAVAPEIRRVILEFLGHRDPALRSGAITYFAGVKISDPEVRGAILQLLDDVDVRVRCSALNYFAGIGAADFQVRRAALKVLGETIPERHRSAAASYLAGIIGLGREFAQEVVRPLTQSEVGTSAFAKIITVLERGPHDVSARYMASHGILAQRAAAGDLSGLAQALANPGEPDTPAPASLAFRLGARAYGLLKTELGGRTPGARYADAGHHALRVMALGEALLNSRGPTGRCVLDGVVVGLYRQARLPQDADPKEAAAFVIRTWRLACLWSEAAGILRWHIEDPSLPASIANALPELFDIDAEPLARPQEVRKSARAACASGLLQVEELSGAARTAVVDAIGTGGKNRPDPVQDRIPDEPESTWRDDPGLPWLRLDEAAALVAAEQLDGRLSLAEKMAGTPSPYEPWVAARAIATSAHTPYLPEDFKLTFGPAEYLPFLLRLCKTALLWSRPWRPDGAYQRTALYDLEIVQAEGIAYDDLGTWLLSDTVDLHFDFRFRNDIHERTGFRKEVLLTQHRRILGHLAVAVPWFPAWRLHYHFDDGDATIDVPRMPQTGAGALEEPTMGGLRAAAPPAAAPPSRPLLLPAAAAVPEVARSAPRDAQEALASLEQILAGDSLRWPHLAPAAAQAILPLVPKLNDRDVASLRARLLYELHAGGYKEDPVVRRATLDPLAAVCGRSDPDARAEILAAFRSFADRPATSSADRGAVLHALVQVLPHLDLRTMDVALALVQSLLGIKDLPDRDTAEAIARKLRREKALAEGLRQNKRRRK